MWETHGNGPRSRGFLGRQSLRLSVLVFFFREESSLRVSERHREMQKGNLDPILLLPKKGAHNRMLMTPPRPRAS